MAAVQQLSGTIVVIIIAVGVQACIILFIFAKRQIQRFALRNRRGPHMSIGHGKLINHLNTIMSISVNTPEYDVIVKYEIFHQVVPKP